MAPCEPSPAPVPFPPVETVPAGVSAPSLARSKTATAFPDAELVIVPGAGHAFPLERPRESFETVARFLDRAIAPGRRRTGMVARAEPFTRAFGLPIGAARTGASLAGLAADRLRRGHVATDR